MIWFRSALTAAAEGETKVTAVDRLSGVHSGLGRKAPVRVATTANITLSGLQTIDGVTVVEDDRVLVKDQSTGANNGIYVASSGAWTRAKDFDGNRDVVQGTGVMVAAGTVSAGFEYIIATANPITIGTTSLSFSTTDEAAITAGSIGTTELEDDGVTNAKLAEMAAATVKGRASGAGTGNPTDLTAAQVRAIIGFDVVATYALATDITALDTRLDLHRSGAVDAAQQDHQRAV